MALHTWPMVFPGRASFMPSFMACTSSWYLSRTTSGAGPSESGGPIFGPFPPTPRRGSPRPERFTVPAHLGGELVLAHAGAGDLQHVLVGLLGDARRFARPLDIGAGLAPGGLRSPRVDEFRL